mgnify:CR=1 FL=1
MFFNVVLPMLLILIVLVGINAPIYAALLGATLFLQVFVNNMPLSSMIPALFESLTKTSLLAVPFFVFAGTIMANTSLGHRLINVFAVTMSRFKAGLAIATLFSNAVFGAISGSAPAATATFGKIAHGPVSKQYNEKVSAGIITSSGALSTIIPPSIMIIIFAIATETSVTDMFLAGFLPGVLIVLIVGIYLVFKCRKMDITVKKASRGEVRKALIESIPVLVIPVIVLGGIYGGLFTPTEAGAVSAAYSLIVGVFVLKDINRKNFFPILKESAKITSQIFILVAVSTVFAQAATVAQFHTALMSLFSGLSATQFLIILNILLLIVGCFFEGGSAILILAPLLAPVGLMLGIDINHLGIVFVVNLSIGMFTPPFGMNIFVSQSVLKQNMGMISRSVVPYIVCYIIALLFITFVPQISLLLPSLL